MTGQLCPECGTPQDAYGRPGAGCDCSERAAIAAAEDFHPLRIRPYVALKEPDGATPSTPPPSLLPPPYDEGEGDGDRSEGADPAETMRLSLPGLRTAKPGAAAADPERAGGRRRFARVALTAAAVVAVIGAASFAGGLFTGDGGGDEATSDLNSGLPTASARPDPSASSTTSASAPGPAAPSTTVSGSAKGTGTGTGTASASASKPAADGPSSPDTGPAAPGAPSAPASASDGTRTTQGPEAGSGATLRRGDSGAEVEELQRRLSEIWLYNDDYDGRFGERVEAAVRVYQSYKNIEGDPSGVYGPNTRRALEAETSGNGRDQGRGGGHGHGRGNE
ncbi:peptidoglycan-binding domain-containing protein [Streptomyces niveus]|uniref:peptidoglycan-binding domain-containing protein n=1 Tax=Streptomyces niveus TaxID=193462 RepID=UPI00343DBF1E